MTEMSASELTLSVNKVKRLLQKENPRVSQDAAIRVTALAEEFIRDVSEMGKILREHANRETLIEADIIAVERIYKKVSI